MATSPSRLRRQTVRATRPPSKPAAKMNHHVHPGLARNTQPLNSRDQIRSSAAQFVASHQAPRPIQKPASAAILAISLPRNRFGQSPHEPRNARQPATTFRKRLFVCQQHLEGRLRRLPQSAQNVESSPWRTSRYSFRKMPKTQQLLRLAAIALLVLSSVEASKFDIAGLLTKQAAPILHPGVARAES